MQSYKILNNIVSKNAVRCCSTKTGNKTSKPTMSKDLTAKTDVTSQIDLEQLKKSRDALQWRTPWHEKEGVRYDLLRSFYSEHNNTEVMKFLQQPLNLTPSGIKKWWTEKKRDEAAFLQSYIPERNQMLGNELAAAHFIVHREGAIKFFGQDNWIKADQFNNYSLPRHYDSNKILQAIDCTDMDLYFEGLSNLRGLSKLEWLSLNDCTELDDWALDKISNLFSETLLYLDIRNLPQITFRGIGALYRMDNLKILHVDKNEYSQDFEMTCLLLEEHNKELQIKFD